MMLHHHLEGTLFGVSPACSPLTYSEALLGMGDSHRIRAASAARDAQERGDPKQRPTVSHDPVGLPALRFAILPRGNYSLPLGVMAEKPHAVVLRWGPPGADGTRRRRPRRPLARHVRPAVRPNGYIRSPFDAQAEREPTPILLGLYTATVSAAPDLAGTLPARPGTGIASDRSLQFWPEAQMRCMVSFRASERGCIRLAEYFLVEGGFVSG